MSRVRMSLTWVMKRPVRTGVGGVVPIGASCRSYAISKGARAETGRRTIALVPIEDTARPLSTRGPAVSSPVWAKGSDMSEFGDAMG